ncbi:hypothetical protein PybrP1_012429 [[Pythium] brassicae (nom. inval.)]|nr:hypothetical protein PybrP1_012429 [[Pythium] brassicae (nom. inval.)]
MDSAWRHQQQHHLERHHHQHVALPSLFKSEPAPFSLQPLLAPLGAPRCHLSPLPRDQHRQPRHADVPIKREPIESSSEYDYNRFQQQQQQHVGLPVLADMLRAARPGGQDQSRASMSSTVSSFMSEDDESAAHQLLAHLAPRSGSDALTTSKRRTARPASRTCKFDGCDQYVVDHGLCVRHGGGKRCLSDGCSSRAKHFGRCWRHGGSMECKIGGCVNRAKSRGFCWSHGGGTRCKAEPCEKIAISNGLCWAHGGGKRCATDGCMKQAYERTRNLCNSHFQQWKRGQPAVQHE